MVFVDFVLLLAVMELAVYSRNTVCDNLAFINIFFISALRTYSYLIDIRSRVTVSDNGSL
jgi:hypothetical protein